ncbi:MAG: tRNA (N6-isopentenyl adenosine(37)-C2)-methylthiotransferase MiaB [Deltaproteobacteria bacterium]|nr:tRNA (N6-isopentenyl adenosine(37)-C2)-methylthiotransferase MiaB [Deltaproteobacteria bacterium]
MTINNFPGLYIKTFGCQMNEYDSERIFALLHQKYRAVTELEEARIVLINTCSVRGKAEKKLYDILGWLEKHKSKYGYTIGVCGCVAQQEGETLLKRWRGVDFVVGTHNISLIPSMIENSLQGLPRACAVDYRDEWETLPDASYREPVSNFVSVDNSASFGAYYSAMRAFVAIQRGCNKNCAFCVVPLTRGPEISRTLSEVLKEIKYKVAQGAKEVFLLGQTVNSYGRDLSERSNFEALVKEVAAIDGVKRIRFASPHPQDVTAGFIKLYQEVASLCPHIHLPLQSGSDKILAAMNRNYRLKRYLGIVQQLKTACPEIAISSDFIVGFPTETDEDFRQTLAAMREVEYSFSYSFKYSARPNTQAIITHKEDNLIAEDVMDVRLKEVQDLQTELCLKFNSSFIGRRLPVIIEGGMRKRSDSYRGRIPHNVLVEIALQPGAEMLKSGDELDVQIIQASPYGIKGNIV